MRIAYVLASLGMGGAERQVLTLAGRMARRGHTVLIVVLRPQLPEEWPTHLDVVYLDMRRRPHRLIPALLRGRRFLSQFQPDLVHSHTYPGNLVARVLHLLAPLPAPVSTVHNVYEGGWLRMLAYRLTDGLSLRATAVSQAAARRFIQLKAVSAAKCQVITNGIDTLEFTPDSGRRARLREQMGVDREFVWFTAGRLVQAKNYPNLLRAFAQVRAMHPEAQLWVAGESTPIEATRFQHMAAQRGMGDAVRYLGLRRDIPALLDAADAFVLGSEWEGMPLAVGEAMAMEKPVVATDVGGVKEMVGEAGLLVPARDANKLAGAMLDVMQRSAQDRQALGRAARERIVTSFNLDAKADEWEALYRAVLADRH